MLEKNNSFGKSKARSSSSSKPYIEVSNMHIVPVIPQRLTFAVLVQRAIASIENSFGYELTSEDLIAVSLPESIRPHILTAISRLPEISLVITSTATALGVDQREVFPVTPGDGLIEAVRLALERQVGLAFIDCDVSPAVLAGRSCVKQKSFCDDRVVLDWGASNYLDLIRESLKQPPSRFEPVATWREFHMSERLRELHTRYRRVLVACDASAVDGLQRRLTSPSDLADAPPSESRLSFEVWNPSVQALIEYLDDLPQLIEAYEKARQMGFGAQFDKRIAILTLISALEKEAGLRFSVRQYKIFSSYLDNLLEATSSLSPAPRQVYSAIRDCFGDAFAERALRRLASYGTQLKVEAICRTAHDVKTGDVHFIISGRYKDPMRTFVARSCNPRNSFYQLVKPDTPPPPPPRSSGSFPTWPLYDQYVNKMRRKISQLTFRRLIKRDIAEFRGSIEAGLEARRTLRSHWNGSSKIFIRRERKIIDPVTVAGAPIVWLFEPREDIRGDIFAFNVFGSSFVSTVCCMGPARSVYAVGNSADSAEQAVNMQRVYGMISFTDMSQDLPKLRDRLRDSLETSVPTSFEFYYGFQGLWWEFLLRTALTYAKKEVVCVLPRGFVIPNETRRYARQLQKTFVRIPLGQFSNHEQRRMQQLYTVKSRFIHTEIASEVNPRIVAAYKDIMQQFWD